MNITHNINIDKNKFMTYKKILTKKKMKLIRNEYREIDRFSLI